MAPLTIVLTTGAGTLLGIGLWMALYYRARRAEITDRQLFILILAVGLTCRLLFLFFTPTFYAPDEQAHFKYVSYLTEHRSFPVQTSRTGSVTRDWEYYQPPLYYLSLTPFHMFFHNLFSEATTVRVLRLCSVLLFSITAYLALRILSCLNVQDLFIRTFVISMVSLLPTYTFLSSVINNDNLLIAIGSAALYFIVRPKTVFHSVLTGILLGLALLTKLTAVVYFILIGLIVLIECVRKKTIAWRSVLHAALPTTLALIIWAPWAWRNWTVYGSVTAEKVANIPEKWKSVFHGLWDTLIYIQESFWAVSGIHNNVRFFYPTIGRHVFYLAVLGMLYGAFLNRQKLTLLLEKNLDIIVAFILAFGIHLGLVIRFGILYNQGQGRFLFPLLIPLSLLMAIGLKMLPGFDAKRIHIHVAGFFIVYAMSFTAFSLAKFAGV